jgi:hypothetical protein
VYLEDKFKASYYFVKEDQAKGKNIYQSIKEIASIVHNKDSEPAKDYTGVLPALLGQPEKIIRLLCSDNSKKKTSTTSSSTSSTTASTAACYARGLTTAHSRKLSTTFGGSTSTRPRVRKITIKTYDFVGTGNAMIPTALGGSTTTSPSTVIVILRQQLDCVIVDYGRADRGAPDKS